MELRPGLVVGQNVRLRGPLGEGGMGMVWAADHLALELPVAIKFLSRDLASDAVARERFRAEAAAAGRIRSPHVVQVLDAGIFLDTPYIVMELLEGEDLHERLVRCGRLGLAETAEILRQVGGALAHVHGQGIVHRDIKPSNIFLSTVAGEVLIKLLDFGIAKHLDRDEAVKTATGTMVGTPAYLSPEAILEPSLLDSRRDLWALAVVAYTCLTGRLPFDGPSTGAIYVAIAAFAFRPPSELNPALAADVDRWFARAFARQPRDRFASARELVDSFTALAGDTGRPALLVPAAAARTATAAAHTDAAATLPLPVGRRAGNRRHLVLAGLGAGLAGLSASWLLPGPEGPSPGADAASASAELAAPAAAQRVAAPPVEVSPSASAPDRPAAPSSSAAPRPAAARAPSGSPPSSPSPTRARPGPAPAGAARTASPQLPPTSTPRRRDHGF